MFDSLVESGSHKDDLARKGSFFLGTLAIYGVVIVGLAILSIVAYNNSLPEENLELMTMVAPVPVQQQAEEQQKPAEQPKSQPTQQQVATRTELVSSTLDPTKVPEKVSAVASKVPPVPPGGAVLGRSNTDVAAAAGPIGPPGPGAGGVGTGGAGPVVKVEEDEPPPPKPTPTPVPKPKAPISQGVLNGKAISKPQPPYPPIAKAARASGTVVVAIIVDESGRVTSAHATSGHPLLQQAATQAAYQARFSPTLLSGQPVKVSGFITYNFVLQ
ncbi:MAG: TonB family protein [Pyrinomonadaceae bacterium]